MKLWSILFLCLFIFSSCDEAPKLSSISKISTTFDTGDNNYPGGLIIVGIREDANERVSYAFANGVVTPIKLEKGDWTFYGMGFSGGAGNFSGTRSCGMKSVSFRKGSETNVDIELSAEGCSGKLSRTLKLKNVTFSSCPALYSYNSDTNYSTTINEYDPATYCNPAGEQLQGITHYKLTALNLINNQASDGFSICSEFTAAVNLPTQVVPFKVSLYRSLHECQLNLAPHALHSMINGLEYGDTTGRDFLFRDISSTDTRLVLADTHTGKFKSPFINMLPRILCEGVDCTTLPSFDREVNIPWNEKLNHQVVLKNVNTNSCSGFSVSSDFFSVKDCMVRNRHAYMSLQRNELSCQGPSGITSGSIVELYSRNGRTYILSHAAGRTNVQVFTADGSSVTSFQVALNTNFIDIAAADDGDIYVMSLTEIRKFTMNSGGAYNLTQSYPFGGLQIEVDHNGNFMLVAIGTDTISSVRTSDGVPINDVFYASTISQLQMNQTNDDLFSLEIRDTPGPPVTSTGFIRKTRFNPVTGVLSKHDIMNAPDGFSGEGMINRSFFMKNFYLNNNLLYTLSDGGQITTLQEDSGTGMWTVSSGPSGPVPDAVKFIVNSGRAYVTNGTVFKALRFSGTWIEIGEYDGSCTENAVFAIGADSDSILMTTVQTPTPAESNPNLIEAGLKLLGRRTNLGGTLSYYFKHLSDEQTRRTFGGYLNTPQRILGAAGVGGMLSDFSCEGLDAAAQVSPVNRVYGVDDPYFGYRSYQITVSDSSEALPAFICDDAAAYGACGRAYDFQINVRSTGLFEKEHYTLKLKCNLPIGEIEYYKSDSFEMRRYLSYWNTFQDQSARYETYMTRQTASHFEAEMATATKFGTNEVWGRGVTINKTPEEIFAKAFEYERDGVSHFFNRIGAKDIPDEYPTNPDYLANKSNVDLSGPASICLNNTKDIPISTASTAGCSITNRFTTSSKGIPLSIESLDDAEVSGSQFQDLFTITP